eukprot:SAG11_NODE_516_length_8817_cov_2.360977_6_plen_111_part_00
MQDGTLASGVVPRMFPLIAMRRGAVCKLNFGRYGPFMFAPNRLKMLKWPRDDIWRPLTPPPRRDVEPVAVIRREPTAAELRAQALAQAEADIIVRHFDTLRSANGSNISI